MSLDARSEALYSLYRSRYGWRYPNYLELCGHLVEGSMARGTTRQSLAHEFYAIEKLDAGSDFRVTAMEMADQGGRTVENLLPSMVELANTPEGRISKDVIRFNTANLGDRVLFVWRFTVGHEYHRRYGEELDWNAFEVASRALSQTEIDSRLRSFVATAAVGNP